MIGREHKQQHHKGRETVKNIVGDNFYLAHIDAELDDCISRDPKGLYKKARAGEITNFTGIDDPYESPENPEIEIDTTGISVEDAVNRILNYLESGTEMPMTYYPNEGHNQTDCFKTQIKSIRKDENAPYNDGNAIIQLSYELGCSFNFMSSDSPGC